MENENLKKYQAELSQAFVNMEGMLSQLQISIGIVKSFSYLIQKELMKTDEIKKEDK